MMKLGLYIRAHRPQWSEDIDIAIINYKKNGKVAVGKLALKEQDEVSVIQPTLTLIGYGGINPVNNTAQVLMDDLWDCGIRPTEGHGSVGQLKATEEHLADMKKITFHQLKIEDKK